MANKLFITRSVVRRPDGSEEVTAERREEAVRQPDGSYAEVHTDVLHGTPHGDVFRPDDVPYECGVCHSKPLHRRVVVPCASPKCQKLVCPACRDKLPTGEPACEACAKKAKSKEFWKRVRGTLWSLE